MDYLCSPGILLIVQKESIQISRNLSGRANISCHEIFDASWLAKRSSFGEIQRAFIHAGRDDARKTGLP